MAKIEQWKEKGVLIYFLPPYSPELNIIEILWRRIKYQWLDFEAYKSFENLKEKLNIVLTNFGAKYDIKSNRHLYYKKNENQTIFNFLKRIDNNNIELALPKRIFKNSGHPSIAG